MYDDYIMTLMRTQILLPAKLREKIDKDSADLNESLSEYLRQAALLRLSRRKKSWSDLKSLADKMIGSVDLSAHPEWNNRQKVLSWQKELRREK
jgi:hypothetical protein